MTLVLTAIAALVVAVTYFKNPAEAREYHLGALALMYLGAALMWCVDGFASLAEGGSFIELSDASAMVDDALLGVVVVVVGAVAWGILNYVSKRRSASAA